MRQINGSRAPVQVITARNLRRLKRRLSASQFAALAADLTDAEIDNLIAKIGFERVFQALDRATAPDRAVAGNCFKIQA
jgi:hypothetical protein